MSVFFCLQYGIGSGTRSTVLPFYWILYRQDWLAVISICNILSQC